MAIDFRAMFFSMILYFPPILYDIAFFGQTSMHLPHSMHSVLLFISGTFIPMGHTFVHALQCIQRSWFTFTSTKLTLLKGAIIAPTGQKYRHHPLPIVDINSRNRRNITNATLKKLLGWYPEGFVASIGMVPVRKPTGQISVNMKPIVAVVIIPSVISIIYFEYLR